LGKLKTLSGIEVFRILEAHGFEKVRQRGSHVVMQKRTSESTVTVPVLDHKEITSRAQNALIRELGVVDTIRFLNQFRAGSGDYTTEREELFKAESVKSIVAEIKAQRNINAQQNAPADRS